MLRAIDPYVQPDDGHDLNQQDVEWRPFVHPFQLSTADLQTLDGGGSLATAQISMNTSLQVTTSDAVSRSESANISESSMKGPRSPHTSRRFRIQVALSLSPRMRLSLIASGTSRRTT